MKTLTISQNLKSKKQHQTYLKVKRENSQTLKTYKMEKNKWKTKLLKVTKEKVLAHQKKKAHKELMDNAASDEELGEKQQSST